MTISEERLQKALNENVPSYLHADTEMRRICHIIATTEDDIEANPGGDAVLLEPDDPEERPYYVSERMLLLERCELDIGHRDLYILDLEIEALEESLRSYGIMCDGEEE